MANNDVKVGAWGGNDGAEWEYPFPDNSVISKIRVVAKKDSISSIQFTCLLNDKQINSPKFGRDSAGSKPEIADNDVKVGAWGGNGGTEWEYPFPDNSVLSKIRVVAKKDCISSIQFTSLLNGKHVNSPKFGRDSAGCKPEIINVGNGQQLTEIKGTFGLCDDVIVIKSLSFKVKEEDFDGPYGDETGTAFSLPVINGKITGFFGNQGDLLDSLGVFIASP